MELDVIRSILGIYENILLKESDITLRVDVRRTMQKLKKLSKIMSEDEKETLLTRMDKQCTSVQNHSLQLKFRQLIQSFRNNELDSSDARPKKTKKFYKVKRIVGFRITGDKSRMYLVRWKGYDSDDDTWEPVHRLLEDQCGDLIARFHKKHMRFH